MRYLIISALLLLFSCKSSKTVSVYGKYGCWQEQQTNVCGDAEKYNSADSTYTMRTRDGWAMKIPASAISWK